MTIIEAVKELRIGRKVKRSYWEKGQYLEGNSHIIKHYAHLNQERNIDIDCDDLLSDNWEIYEEQSPMEKAWRQIDNQGVWMSEHVKDLAKTHFENGWNAAQKHFTEK